MPDNNLLNGEVDEKFQALLSNANAARVIAQSIEGTIGPKGLDIMMVDSLGDVVISNDGVTILKLMAVNHPAARMIINAARAQQAEVGDGTTTATILAGALIAEGTNQIIKGVPVTQVTAGIKAGIERSIELITEKTRSINSLTDAKLLQVAAIAGRGQEDIAGLIVEAARVIGREKLLDPDFKLVNAVVARETAVNQVFNGVLLNREPLNPDTPQAMQDVKVLVVDDSLAPEEMDSEARSTEAGFQRVIENKQQFENNLRKICELGIKLIVVDRGIDDVAEQTFAENEIIALERVSHKEINRLCKHTGARKLKRNTLNRPPEQLCAYLGYAEQVIINRKMGSTFCLGGKGESLVTIMIGAATEELVDEKERISRDAAAAVQAALQAGVVPGGGAMELWIAQRLEELARESKGMTSYGILCVKEALLKPFACIAANAGFNPLEKMADVIAEQQQTGLDSLGLDCDRGQVIDLWEEGIIDPSQVKIHAFKAAGEVAIAILRINTIIKMREGETYPPATLE